MAVNPAPAAHNYPLILTILLLCSMFFSASETAFLSLSNLRIRYLREKKVRAAARVEWLLAHRESLITSILIGNNIVNISASAIVTTLIFETFGAGGVGLATVLTTVIILIFGEILPKTTALTRPEFFAMGFSMPLLAFFYLTAPAVFLLNSFTRLLRRLSGSKPAGRKSAVSEDDIRTLIDAGTESGTLEDTGGALMHKILKYTDLNARDIMTPRTDMIAIPLTATAREILEISHNSSLSRFPVYQDNVDEILGVLYIKDFLFADIANPSFSVRSLMRPPLFVFESQKISAIQKQLREGNRNLAVVLDEYGGTAGIVTTEDLVIELFGGIRDEFDTPEADRVKTVSGPVILSGAERIGDVNERFNLTLASKYHETIAGLFMELTGSIPEAGETVLIQGVEFTVTAIKARRIETLQMDDHRGHGHA